MGAFTSSAQVDSMRPGGVLSFDYRDVSGSLTSSFRLTLDHNLTPH